jgi:hypothetical protein
MAQEIELGLDTFGDIQAGPDGQPLSLAQVIRNVVDEGVLADQSGVFCIGLGKHQGRTSPYHRRRRYWR